ncbi:MAG: thiamine-phosphate synthase family protein, partial [Candidatus Thermoplasmatota archaeon]|nr:thiamine-phosphate synthase family protein [Candidatus Thermoplasmatota archaeon]
WLSLQDAVDELLSFLPVSLIPEVGINFVYAMADASSYGDICGIDGRIVRAKKPFQAGECRFGTSKHISSVLLACMKHDASIRAAMNIAYSVDTINACHAIGLKVGNFDRKDEPAGRSTMEWGTDHVVKEMGFVPDVVWDKGGVGKEAMIRVIGESPNDVLEKVKAIVKELELEGKVHSPL